ncbi:hypothetical protein AZE42_05533 [Rhizopogon vesiculosus]|uniref:Uncharacterized protein n=1 Tax=Rhizopogon vesiculosus TaxID=180088 RepID=A0A1J8QJD1_9AGAM|nr:hypothetical protein AZE42_05533 [Rhizopogon vesiculosus]
MESSKYVRLHA